MNPERLHLDLQCADVLDVDPDGVPGESDFRRWVAAALDATGAPPAEIALLVVGAEEGHALNARWRGRDAPTNVLSFPAELPEVPPEALPLRPLGDLVLCAPVVLREAAGQGKPAAHHWAHLTVHGVLHLLGHDHQDSREAEDMEALERRILAGLDIPDPYAPGA